VCSVDPLTTALTANTVGNVFIPTPPVTLPAVAEFPAIHASVAAHAHPSVTAGALVPTPAPLEELSPLRAIGASVADAERELPSLVDNAGDEMLVSAGPLVLPQAAELPVIDAPSEIGEDDLLCAPESIVSCEVKSPEPPHLQAAPTVVVGAGSRRSLPTPSATPNGRQRRKIMRRLHANDWTA
jgi:hypothetical protein